MKSILVIGMGMLGRCLAAKMQELGNDVMIIDKDEEKIQELSTIFGDAIAGDCTNPAVLKSIGVNNFDYCFVAIGEDFYASLEITSILKELGATFVVSKAKRLRQAEFLKKIGADEVFYPEKEIAEKLAVRYNATNIFDYIELTSDHPGLDRQNHHRYQCPPGVQCQYHCHQKRTVHRSHAQRRRYLPEG